MTVHNILKHAFPTLIVATLAIPLHVSASEPDGLATQFQATAAEAAASFREERIVNLANSIRPPHSAASSAASLATRSALAADGPQPPCESGTRCISGCGPCAQAA